MYLRTASAIFILVDDLVVTIYTVHNVNQVSGNLKRIFMRTKIGWEVFLKVGYRIFYAINV